MIAETSGDLMDGLVVYFQAIMAGHVLRENDGMHLGALGSPLIESFSIRVVVIGINHGPFRPQRKKQSHEEGPS